jgi:hypothetical protein
VTCAPEPLYDIFMANHAAFPHVFEAFAHQCVLVGVHFDVIRDGLVDEIAARAILGGGKGIERIDLFGISAEADGFFWGHDTVNIPRIISDADRLFVLEDFGRYTKKTHGLRRGLGPCAAIRLGS